MAPIEAEKSNLTLHVELQAIRDKDIDHQIDDIKERISELANSQKELANMIRDMIAQRNGQLIKWGAAIIATLISALGILCLKLLVPVILGQR